VSCHNYINVVIYQLANPAWYILNPPLRYATIVCV